MAISSVSASGASATSSLASVSVTDEETKKKLAAYGIVSTGNLVVDKAKLEAAEQAKDEKGKKAALSPSAKAPKQNDSCPIFIPEQLQSILTQLGIEVKKGDDIDTLIGKASDVINEKLNDKNLSPSDKAKYEALKAQLGKFQEQIQAQSPSAMTGATALSSLNKSLFL